MTDCTCEATCCCKALGSSPDGDPHRAAEGAVLAEDRMVVVSALAAMVNGVGQIRTMKFRGGNYGAHAEAECDKRVSELERAAKRLNAVLWRTAPPSAVSPETQQGQPDTAGES